jgi:hypothetical protein
MRYEIYENTTTVGSINVLNPENEPITYSISGGDSAYLSIDSTTGILSFLTAPDFENPQDANVDNIYEFTVMISAGDVEESSQVNVSVLDDPDSDIDGIEDLLDDDDDNDGMPDTFEIEYGLLPLDPADASLDKDNDSFTNLQEYLDGTDPTVFDNPDSDGDGVLNHSDNCPSISNADQADSDSDGVGNVCDNCSDDPNKIEPGSCGCGALDTDTDSDGTADCNDDCLNDTNKTVPGQCGCGTLDTDTDNDGTANCNDACPNDLNKTVPGQCGCGIPDTDNEPDGMLDCWEIDNNLDPNVDDADDDQDEDGFSNIEEYQKGTNPTDPNSHPSQGMPWMLLLLE